jgi:hypothetical protein
MLAIAALGVFALAQMNPSVASRAALFDSPLPTPTPQPPAPIPTPGPSEAAQAALAYIANREGIPADDLKVVADHPTEYPNLGRKFQVITLVDTRPQGQVYKLLVDLQSGHIEQDVSALLAAEARAHQARYGKLQRALYERLQPLKDDETLPVAIWVAASPGQSLAEQQARAFAVLAARYPEVREVMERFGKPMDVSDPELRQRVESEYLALLAAQTEARTQPLVTELGRRGFTIATYTGMPFFTAVLPKRVVLELARRPDVSAIYLIETKEQPALDSAVPTSLAPFVWNRGYDGRFFVHNRPFGGEKQARLPDRECCTSYSDESAAANYVASPLELSILSKEYTHEETPVPTRPLAHRRSHPAPRSGFLQP